jgi:hypothetical protein
MWNEFLAMELVGGVHDAQSLTASWKDKYNTRRPDSPLRYRTPARSAAACADYALAAAFAPALQASSLGGPVPMSA